MTTTSPSTIVDDKPAVAHVEHRVPDTNAAPVDGKVHNVGPTVSPSSQVGLLESLRTYKFASIICILAAVGALSDGYQVQMSGSIVALPGFIRTFGDLQPDGEYKIDPQHISLWGCKSCS